MSEHDFDVVVIGGGQAGLAMGYYLREQRLRFANMAGVFSLVRAGCAIAAPVTTP
jgi:glycine/D-amino acid oxidase-like deaminating enzyme